METTNFEAMQVGDRIRVKSGKVYQVTDKTEGARAWFRQWREDRQALFGPIKHFEAANVELVTK